MSFISIFRASTSLRPQSLLALMDELDFTAFMQLCVFNKNLLFLSSKTHKQQKSSNAQVGDEREKSR